MDQNFTAQSEIVSEVIRSRRTQKVLAKTDHFVDLSDESLQRGNTAIYDAIGDAGFAPFHYDRNLDDVSEPWRFYVIHDQDCRWLATQLASWHPDMKAGNKLPAMLRACGSLVLVNWLPQFQADCRDEKQIQVDEEHLAAAAAATQNLLLSLEAKGLKTYWSSGGFFRTREMRQRLGIPADEKLLAAIFVDYGAENDIEIIGGKQHSNRKSWKAWTKTLELRKT